MKSYKLIVLVIVSLSAFFVTAQNRPTAVPLECGAIVEGELTADDPGTEYILMMGAGTQITLIVEPLGDGFNPFLVLLDSGRSQVFQQNFTNGGIAEEIIDYTISSSNSILQVYGAERNSTSYNYSRVPNSAVGVYYGAYEISLDCTLRDGTRIPAGSTIDSVAPPANSAPVAVAPAFSGFGFPGLAPIDFSNVARLPIPAGIPMSGAVTANGSEILGYLFEANAGDTVEIAFKRLSGNLNLGLVVINANSDVIFQSSLVTTQSLTTQFTIPESGEYTAGILRIDLLPPASPEATAFQVSATVNP